MHIYIYIHKYIYIYIYICIYTTHIITGAHLVPNRVAYHILPIMCILLHSPLYPSKPLPKSVSGQRILDAGRLPKTLPIANRN